MGRTVAWRREPTLPLAYPRRRKHQQLAAQATELAQAVPEVLAHRMTRMSLAGHSPSLRDQREFYLMWGEKVAAFYESWNAILIEVLRANLKFALSPMYFWLSPWTTTMRMRRLGSKLVRTAAVDILVSGLAPLHRRAVANARRLRRMRAP